MKTISYSDMVRFINVVVSGSTRNGEYIPEARLLLTRLEAVRNFTDYEIKSDTSDIDKLCEELYSEEVSMLVSNITSKQYLDILIAIDERIESMKNKLYSLACDLVIKMSNSIDSINDKLSKISTEDIKELIANEASKKSQ